MSEFANFPPHGRLGCRLCFDGTATFQEIDKWQMRHDPGSWGSETPRYLVRGFSKGATQVDIFSNGSFDDVAFGGARTRTNLTRILRRIGLLKTTEKVDERIKATEQDFHFGSLVRCSLARLDEGKSREKRRPIHVTSGPLMSKSFAEVPQVVDRCTDKFLRKVPESLRVILVLGISSAYVRRVCKKMKQLHPQGFRIINPVAYENERLLWVHLTHPSKGNGTLNAWLQKRREESTSALKRELAIEALVDRGIVSTANIAVG